MMRKLLAKVLGSMARITLKTVEVVIAGVRTVVNVFVPTRPTPYEDVAEDVLEEAPAAGQDTGRRQAHLERMLGTEAQRVKRAAKELAAGRDIPASWLDANDQRQAEILTWLGAMGDLPLGIVAKAEEGLLDLHLTGIPSLPVPLLPVDQAPLDAKAERRRPLDYHEWMKILIAREAQIQGEADGMDEERLMEEALALSRAYATIDDYEPAASGASPAGVSEDGDE